MKKWSMRALSMTLFLGGAWSAVAQEPAELPIPTLPVEKWKAISEIPVIQVQTKDQPKKVDPKKVDPKKIEPKKEEPKKVDPPVVETPKPAETVVTPVAPTTVPCETCNMCGPFDFKNVPPIRPAQRVGPFPILPTGPGYYSVLDQIRGDCQQGPPKYPYPRFGLMQPSFFDASFAYLDDPKNTEHDYMDPLKRIHLGDDWLLSFGGQAWARAMNEYNSRLGRVDNSYLLTRNRTYADLWYKDIFRFYVEGIYASSSYHDLAPLPIDRTGVDFLNLFVDIKLADVMDKPLYARLGRQELLLGSQRLVSTLDWANTRRTFQGASVLRTGEKWDFNAWWLQPVITNTNQLDWVNNQQHFAGGWLTYKPKKGQAIDLYNMTLINNNPVVQQTLQRGTYTVNTTGFRYVGDKDNFLWDVEMAGQIGRQGQNEILAGMATGGLGYNFKETAWNPTFWLYYDYASGDGSPNSGRLSTFNQLFPFGHYYMGWADLVGRQNIQDLNAHMYLYPTKWYTLWLQYHRFWLANKKDALYNVAGNVSRLDKTGNAGNDVGHEIDIVNNFHLTKHSDIMVGYSQLFSGTFIKKTAPVAQKDGFDSSLFYLMYTYKW